MFISRTYKFANINVRVSYIKMAKKWPVLSSFEVASDVENSLSINIRSTEYGFKVADQMQSTYKEEHSRIYENSGEIYYVKESFEGEKCSQHSWTSCLHYTLPAPDAYDIYFHSPPSSEKDIFNAMCLDLIMAHHNRVILHSAYITYRGEGIVFTAPSGTGKSTQAELWANSHDDVEIINGDRSILSCDGDRPMVHGLPFCGTSGICKNVSAPLRAAVVLRQGRENRIRRLGPAEAIRLLMSECAVSPWDSDGTRNILDLLIRIVERIPVYYFSCVPDQSAVRVLEEALEGK